ASFTPEAEALAAAFWPGPLTLVLPLRADAGVASLVTAGLETVAIRVPAHPLAQAVLRATGRPLAAPSANPSGRISPVTADHVLNGLDGRIAAVIDGGRCGVGLESTIIGWPDGRATLLRPGGLSDEEIAAITGPLLRHSEGGSPTAPGQLSSHYAPNAPLRLNATQARPGEALIGFGPVAGEMSLSQSGDLHEAAANLFEMLRRADELGRPIAVAPVPATGLGLAINDRLIRAAAPR
ncbi:MAG: L-threonylcarbamoyladenylate synthase, partial [Paracoccus sp. (in: a-proteobacteria)]|nr:L-threonylcarbamoyladenylate synthase [Paracoccus sp. (in: a-proteobacteria)]